MSENFLLWKEQTNKIFQPVLGMNHKWFISSQLIYSPYVTLQNSCTVPAYKWKAHTDSQKKTHSFIFNPHFSLFIKSEINYEISVQFGDLRKKKLIYKVGFYQKKLKRMKVLSITTKT